MNEKLQGIVAKVAGFAQLRYVRVLTNGFMSIAAISICGSVFSLLTSLPFDAYQTFIENTGLYDLFAIPVSVCSDVISLYVAAAMGMAMGKEFKMKDPFACALVSLGAFLVLTPFTAASIDYTTYEVTYVSNALGTGSTGALGARGIFLAMISGLLSARMYIFLVQKKITIKMPDSVPENVAGMFEMMIPGGLTYVVFLVVRWAFGLTSYGTAQTFIYTVIQTPLMAAGGGLGGALLYLFAEKFLWFFGIHGGLVAYSAMSSIMTVANSANLSALAEGVAVSYPEWALVNVFCDFSVLPLTICMLIFAKSSQYKALSKISTPTSIFNISEPLVFGVPIIMNPIIAVPYVLICPLALLLTMGVINLGLVAAPTGVSINTIYPTIISLALATGSWTGAVWAVILVVLCVIIYIPFFKILDNQALEREKAMEAEAAAAEAAEA